MRRVLEEISLFFTTGLIIYTCIIRQVHAVDGKWGEWDSWSDCTKTCGDGYQLRHRECNNPPPLARGKYCDYPILKKCTGSQHCDFRSCNQADCPVRVQSDCMAAKFKGVELCTFPFHYKSKWYYECTTMDSPFNQEWCSINTYFIQGDRCFCEGSNPDCEQKNIAYDMKASQSSTYLGRFEKTKYVADGFAKLAVDGKTDNDFLKGGSCTYTNREQNPWWAVDLGSIFYVQEVVIYNRNQYQERLNNLLVYLYSGDPNNHSERPTLDNLNRKGSLCGSLMDGKKNKLEVRCDHEGRRVVLTVNPAKVNLTLCEVEVYGCKKIYGGFGPFSQWSVCSATCGGGNQFRTRECNNPPPKYGETDCHGLKLETNRCNEIDCPDPIESIDECSSGPCGEHASSCIDKYSQYKCVCKDGFTGIHCEIELDECDSRPCQNSGGCTDHMNGYSCKCAKGFFGMNCETDVDDCQVKPCKNGGTCTDQEDNFLCDCAAGYTDLKCETDIDECESKPCQNNGTCDNRINAFSCQCSSGFTGEKCETNINECSPSPCLNNGYCIDGVNGYSCECPAKEYSGDNCEIESSRPTQPSRQEGIGRKALPPLIGGVFASVICVIILVAAIVKYRLRNSSNKDDRTKLTSVTLLSPRASRSATPEIQIPNSSKGVAPERKSPRATSSTSQSPRASSPNLQSPRASSPTSHKPRSSGAGQDC